MEILNVTLKLLIVYLLCIGNFDKLILYASLMLAVSILIMMVYRIYAIRQFPEAHFHWIWDKTHLRPLLSFSGWDLYGNACVIARQQGTNFLINIFYGVVFNAASGIATTVQGTISGLAFNIILAFRPQIIKQYAKGNVEDMSKLVGNAVCFTTILFGCMSIPLLLETHYIMKAWLGTIPDKSVIFCQILLIASFLGLLNNIWNTCIHATGKIKELSIISGTIYLISLPIIYIVFECNAPVESAYIVFILVAVLVNVNNLAIIKRRIPKFQFSFIFLNYIKIIIILIASYYITSLINAQMQESFIRLLVECIVCIIIIITTSFISILNKTQKKSIINKICQKLA